MHGKARRIVVLAVLAFSVVFILWLTLFSRLESDTRHFYPPFWSYRAIAAGSDKALLEVLGNIILFLPIGLIAALILHLNLWQTVLLGFSVSMLIESCQWFFWLGSFEIDDLLHNTLGAVIGAGLVGRVHPFQGRKRNTRILVSLIVLTILIGIGYQGLKNLTMKRYAAMNDRADGAKNLLVLSSDPKYVGQNGFNLVFNSDGSMRIEGKAEKRAWIQIGRLSLPQGHYTFTGFSDVPEKTIGIELEYFDKNQEKYMRLTPDIGPLDGVDFELEDTTKLRVLIGLYAGVEGEYTARPAIYQEE